MTLDSPRYTKKGVLPTSGITLDVRTEIPPGRQDDNKHSFDRALHRNLLSDRKYQQIRENKDFETIRRIMKNFCIRQIVAYRPGRGHGPLYDGKGTLYQLLAKRNRFIKLAQEYDMTHPQEMWSVLVLQLAEPTHYVKFYNTLEELLTEHLDGKFYIEVFTNGSVRIIKEGKVISIFHLSATGVAEYRKLMAKPIASTDSRQDMLVFTALVINKGLMFTPGPHFLSVKKKEWCDGEGSGRMEGFHRDHDRYQGCKKDRERNHQE